MSGKKEMQVSAIENGTVIDRIPSEKLFMVMSILGLDKVDTHTMTFGMNLRSNALSSKRKAIIKLWDRYLADSEINKLALVSREIKINLIKDYEVVEKKEVEIPDKVYGIVKCMNPKCVTNCECVRTRFKAVSKEPFVLKCEYCETYMNEKQIEII